MTTTSQRTARAAEPTAVMFRYKFVEAVVDGPAMVAYDQFSVFTAKAKWVRMERRDRAWVATKTTAMTVAEDVNGTIRWGDNKMGRIRITEGANKPAVRCHFDKPKTASHTYSLLIGPGEGGKKQTYLSPPGSDGTVTVVSAVITPAKSVTVRL
jgi:hypothetical protein